jgi:tetratricopeptide (TPR) repeat protein
MVAGDTAAAFGYARLAIHIDPESAAAWHNLGVLFAREHRLQAAERAYLTALAYDPDSDASMGNLERTYRQQGKLDEADALASRLRRQRQRNPYFPYALGRQWMEEDNYQNAMIFFEEAIDRKGDEELFYYALAEAQMALGYYHRAERSLESARRYARDPALERYHRLASKLQALAPEG